MANTDTMKLQVIVQLTERQKAIIVSTGQTIPASPMSFRISKSTAAIIARMTGEMEVSDSKIYAGFGGFGSQLYVPHKLNLSDLIAKEITSGAIAEGANIDHIFEEVKIALDENDAESQIEQYRCG